MDYEPPICTKPRPKPKHQFDTCGYDLIHFEATRDRYGVYSRDPYVRGPFETPMMFSGTLMECKRWMKRNRVLTPAELDAAFEAEVAARKAMFA